MYTRSQRTRTIAATALVMLTMGLNSALAGEWKGTTSKDKDGHTVVMSPAQGYEPSERIEMQELWRLGGESDDENEFFGVIADIQIDKDGNVYLLDGQLNVVKVTLVRISVLTKRGNGCQNLRLREQFREFRRHVYSCEI